MSAAIILDTETTGIDEPEVIELAYIGPLPTPFADGEPRVERYKPSKAISLGAMAAHHIIAADLEECRPWQGFAVPAGVEYLIGHRVDFDWEAIGSPPGVRRICTLALSRHMFPTLDSHTLSAMIYHIYPHAMARQMVQGAHSAGTDVKLTRDLLFSLNCSLAINDWEQLWLKSEQARVPTMFTWGKFQGTPIAEVKRLDPGYIRWCLSGKCDLVNDDPYMRKALER